MEKKQIRKHEMQKKERNIEIEKKKEWRKEGKENGRKAQREK